MPYITPRGNPNARLWLIMEAPFGSDIPKSFLLSGGMGFVLEKMLKESGLSYSDLYCCCRRPNTDDPNGFGSVDSALAQYMPPLILVLNECGGYWLPELKQKGEESKGQLQKYAGSLLTSKMLGWPHYMMPIYGPDRAVVDWAERNVTTYVDLQKMREELEWFRKNNKLKPLPERKLVYGDLSIDEVLQALHNFEQSTLLSVDIETVYPRQKSAFLPHPGYPITIGIADSINYGISFNLFRNIPSENRTLWRSLESLLSRKRILGQNFFNFDALFFEALGFRLGLSNVQDTLLRHHILWPELSHKLQFMTRQYTREPYYKDEGHGWSIKHMDRLRRYNCLDVCVTYEIYEQQELEFAARPHLRG